MIRYFNVYYEDERWLCVSLDEAKKIVGSLVVNNSIDYKKGTLKIATNKRGVATDIVVSFIGGQIDD